MHKHVINNQEHMKNAYEHLKHSNIFKDVDAITIIMEITQRETE